MPYVVVPVIGQKSHHIKSVRIIDSQVLRLSIHAGESAELSDGEGDHPVSLASLSEHPTLADAVSAARELVGDPAVAATDHRGLPVGFA